MSQPVKLGFNAGIVGLILLLLYGGWSVLLIGILAGAAVGLMLDHDSGHDRQRILMSGVTAGAVTGVMLLIGQVLHDFVILPLAGRTAEAQIAPTLLASLAAVVLPIITAALMAVLNNLPEPNRRYALLAALVVFLVAYPTIDRLTGLAWIEQMISIMIFIVLALGLNIVVGYAGLLDLGYAAFFAIGAYTTGLLLTNYIAAQTGADYTLHQQQWAFWLVIWIAAAVAAIFGVILGAPTLPLRGDYLAIVTLGFGEIVPVVFRNLTAVVIKEPLTGICLVGCERALNITAGERGINPIAKPWLPGIGTFQTGEYLPWYALILVIIAFSIFMINRLRQSRLGRAWAAMREDELAAAAMGIDIVNTKLLAFAMGATFSGFAGAFYGSYLSAIFPSVFDFTVSVIILCMVILGGLGNMAGVIVGGLIIMMSDRIFLADLSKLMRDILNASVLPNVANPAVQDFLTVSLDPTQWRLFLFGLTLVLMMLVRPEGLIPNVRRRAELRAGEEVAAAEAPVAQDAQAPAK